MLIDLTHSIRDGMPVYPGDTETQLIQTAYLTADHYNGFELGTGMHAGTHIDGPMHMLDTDRTIGAIPLDLFIGQGCLLNVTGEEVISYRPEYEQLIAEGSIVLLHTGHDAFYGQEEYYTRYPALSEELAELFVRKSVKMVGTDTPSPDYNPFAIHRRLLSQGILILENLTNLGALVGIGSFEVIALPLKIEADSSIARVIARTGQGPA
ncbi:cyclase family protein [Gorillibacterium sp. sgz5001074]|uniref:cyclase family protein n=1 Tax=Gorillibacterium sp. sgz5001074 TaxID=3446695 RepID=UPI003F66AE90